MDVHTEIVVYIVPIYIYIYILEYHMHYRTVQVERYAFPRLLFRFQPCTGIQHLEEGLQMLKAQMTRR